MTDRPPSKKRVRWTPRAQDDLIDIRAYIARRDPDAARRWITRLYERGNAAVDLPLAGRAVPEVADPTIREVLLGGYRIIYRVAPDGIDVLTVVEGHRRLPLDAIDDTDP